MPRFKERLWKVEEIIGMGETISRLRQMRSAAVMKNPTMSVRIKKVLLGWAGSQEPIYLQQETLAHAEQLADATGDFLQQKSQKQAIEKMSIGNGRMYFQIQKKNIGFIFQQHTQKLV